MPETSTSASKNILASDVDVKGTIRFESELIFDGKLEGEIVSEAGLLTLGKNANVHGEVKTKAVVVHGTVTGNITVMERAELKASSQLTGDLAAQRIIIEEGATFIGRSEVTPNRGGIARAATTTAATSSAPAASATPASDNSRKNQPATAS